MIKLWKSHYKNCADKRDMNERIRLLYNALGACEDRMIRRIKELEESVKEKSAIENKEERAKTKDMHQQQISSIYLQLIEMTVDQLIERIRRYREWKFVSFKRHYDIIVLIYKSRNIVVHLDYNIESKKMFLSKVTLYMKCAPYGPEVRIYDRTGGDNSMIDDDTVGLIESRIAPGFYSIALEIKSQEERQ